MLVFLSPAWLQAFDAELRADSTLATRFAATPIAIAQHVIAEPVIAQPAIAQPAIAGHSAAVRYVMVLDGAGGRLISDPAEVEVTPADVTFVSDRDTAADLARGTTNAQRALTSGRLKVRGEVERLAVASAALASAGDVLAGLRENTEF